MPLIPVRFELTAPKATAVSVAGTFNQWQPQSAQMHATDRGVWLKTTALHPGNYEYRFVVDGQWQSDPTAVSSVPNSFGESNSVLTVTTPEGDHLTNAENIPFVNQNNQPTQNI